MSPQIDDDGVPDRCLSFTVRSTWGHFKRVGRSVTKQTYRIPPRTTVAGMLAAIVGAERDSYYDIFGEDTSAIAITPMADLRTINIPTVGVGTDPGQDVTTTAGNYYSEYNLTYQDTENDRQLHAYEVLADPAYESTSRSKTKTSTLTSASISTQELRCIRRVSASPSI